MAKEVTAKDVIYALEYLGDALIRKSISDGRSQAKVKAAIKRAAIKGQGHV